MVPVWDVFDKGRFSFKRSLVYKCLYSARMRDISPLAAICLFVFAKLIQKGRNQNENCHEKSTHTTKGDRRRLVILHLGI